MRNVMRIYALILVLTWLVNSASGQRGKNITPKRIVDYDPILQFDLHSVELSENVRHSLDTLTARCQKGHILDLDSFYVIFQIVSCKKETIEDSLIGYKRCSAIFRYIEQKSNNKLQRNNFFIRDDANSYYKDDDIYCFKVGVEVHAYKKYPR